MIKKITEWVNCYDIFTNIRPNVFLSSEMEDGFEYKAYIPLSMMEPDYIHISTMSTIFGLQFSQKTFIMGKPLLNNIVPLASLLAYL